MTALTVYPSNVADGTLTTAGGAGSATGGTASSSSSKIGTSTGYGELWALSNASAWAAAGSIGGPDGNGWIWDVATLVGQTLATGNWTPTIRVRTSSGTANADFYIVLYKYNTVSHVYTSIGTCSATGNALTTGFLNLTFSPTSLGAMAFSTNEVLYWEIWPNITSNSTGSGAATLIILSLPISQTRHGASRMRAKKALSVCILNVH
jgi:hypothetical protein